MEMAMVLFATLFIFLFLSAPIYVALTASSLITMFIFGDYSLSAVMQRIFGGMDKFALMSLPFYVLAADIMTVGGMSKKIVDFVNVAGQLPWQSCHRDTGGQYVFWSIIWLKSSDGSCDRLDDVPQAHK